MVYLKFKESGLGHRVALKVQNQNRRILKTSKSLQNLDQYILVQSSGSFMMSIFFLKILCGSNDRLSQGVISLWHGHVASGAQCM